MKSRFESPEWLAALARLVQSDDVDSAASALADAIGAAVEHEGTCLLAFHRDAPPEVFHHTLEPAIAPQRIRSGTPPLPVGRTC